MKMLFDGSDGRGHSMVEVAFNCLCKYLTRQRGQREEDECNNQIKVEYVGGKRAVNNMTRGGGR